MSDTPFDPSACKPGYIKSIGNGGTIFVGDSATRLFQMKAIIGALRLEIHGISIRRGVSALRGAKHFTGLKTRNRQLHIDKLQAICRELETNITVERNDDQR